jgi:peptide/nickel transport system permease protein
MRTVFGVSSSSYNGTVYKNLASYINNPQIANLYIAPWLEANNIAVGSTELSVLSSKGSQIIFMKLTPAILTNPELLEGEYKLRVDIISRDESVSTGFVSLSLIGTCYGVLGTDVYGRDLSQAVLYGIRWALIIGLLVAFVSTLAGGLYGILSGYYGGLIDEILLRIAQIVYSIPVLPLLIILSYMLKPSIWNLVGLLIAFGWPGTALVTRSMALQLKEETYVEAARAFGASHGRIILKYILPQTLPYLFASMALGVPGAILTEAAVSFLGLGDPTKITWGRILNEAQASMATVNGYWWWVIPPGLMIMVAGTTFIFIGYALDTVLNPRLKR